MTLGQLLDGIYDGSLPQTFLSQPVKSISSDSRKVEPGSLFVALQGHTYKGGDFIEKAIGSGARFIVTDESITSFTSEKVCHLTVKEPSEFLRKLAIKFYDNPSVKIKVIGVTGTNGKTTITYLVEALFKKVNKSCGVIGTVNYRLGEDIQVAQNTTPSLLDIQKLLAEMHDKGAEYCVMEVSSHALDQGRVDLVQFNEAIFTNLTSDHLDYHKTRENYFNAKSLLFTSLGADRQAIINIDDSYGQKLVSKTQAQVMSYGIKNNARVKASDIEIGITGTTFKLTTPDEETIIRTKLVGLYNVYNILAAVSLGVCEGLSLDKMREAIEGFELVPGRLERVECGKGFSVFIDFAHTQDALENVLRAIRQTTDSKIILVFGCGGDRDRTKRPLMGKVAGQLADFTIVTSDNPRSENPEDIIHEITPGFERDNFIAVVDRKQAIGKALAMAKEGDVVLIAGKGHEAYQIFKDQTIKFNERQIVREFLLC
jgi:UDP-N-acetylmuramoyl-L-alanyl-D-glutamate--2,6-diaminopimelate ligase